MSPGAFGGGAVSLICTQESSQQSAEEERGVASTQGENELFCCHGLPLTRHGLSLGQGVCMLGQEHVLGRTCAEFLLFQLCCCSTGDGQKHVQR